MRSNSVFQFDILIFLATISLMVIGVLFVYSSGVSSTGIVFSKEYIKQIIWAISGIGLIFTLSFIDYNRIRALSPYIYFFFIILLLVTFFFGERVNGAKSWLGLFNFGIQPSEFAKIATILLLSAYYSSNRDGASSFKNFIFGLGIVLVPVVLILIQPDLGTALVYLPIFLFVSFIAGAKPEHIGFVLFTAILVILLTILPVWQNSVSEEEIRFLSIISKTQFRVLTFLVFGGISALSVIGFLVFKKNYFYWIFYATIILSISLVLSLIAGRILQDYQLMRLVVFLDPTIDPQGAGWNIIQSVTAVGSGGIVGKGFLSGTQSHYQFLPQQSTDFIFSIIAEEWGFLGGAFVFLLFSIIFMRGVLILSQAKDNFARYVVSGILGMIFFHFLINIGMAMGIMPITGIPLFFLSYGGSSLWTAAIGIGLLLNIHMKRYRM